MKYLLIQALATGLISSSLLADSTGSVQTSETTNIYYELSGSGATTLVLLHGYGVTSSFWKEHVKVLKKHYSVLTIDLRGHGKSSKPQRDYTLDAFATDVHQVITQLNIHKPIMIGWSLGGHIAQYYATRYPDTLAKLILVCTSACFTTQEGYTFGLPPEAFKASADQVRSNPEVHYQAIAEVNFNDQVDTLEAKKNKEMLLTILRQNDPEALAQINEYFADGAPSLISNLDKISLPTLIIVAGLDAGVPPGASFYMYTKIPHASLSVFPAQGHALPISNKRGFLKVIHEFIQGMPLSTIP